MLRVLLAGAGLLSIASPAAALPTTFKAQADAYLSTVYDPAGPGAVILVTEHGRPVYRNARGLADVEAGCPLQFDTNFRYASITKQFTAAMVMRLVEAGKVRLDDPLSAYLDDYPAPGRDATVRQLLTHTSGIANYTALPGIGIDTLARPHRTDEMIALFKDQPLDFKPGTNWSYDNSGYTLLQAIIEKATGLPFGEAIEGQLLDPLGLTQIRAGDFGSEAIGYGRDGSGVVVAPPIDLSVPGGAGVLVGNADALAAWMDALHGGRVVRSTSYRAMTTPVTLTDGSKRDYGFGLSLGKVQGSPWVGHSGGIFGFSGESLYLTAPGIGIVVLSNSDAPPVPPETVAIRLAALTLDKPLPADVPQSLDPTRAAGVAGIYGQNDDEQRVWTEDGKLYLQAKKGVRQDLIPVEADTYLIGRGSLKWARFLADGAHRSLTIFGADGAPGQRLAWIAAPPTVAKVAITEADITAVSGRYKGPMGMVTVGTANGGPLTFQIDGEPALPMRAVSSQHFAIDEVGAEIEVKPDRLLIQFGGRTVEALRQP